MNYYYLDENNRPVGPLALEDIREKAASGAIPRTPMVAPEGANKWQRLSAIGAPSGFRLERFLPELVESVLRSVGRALNLRFLNGSIEVSRDVGHYGGVAAGLLAIVCAIVAAFEIRSAVPLGAGLALAVMVIGSQYVAVRFFAVNEKLLTSSTVRISSLALLDCVGLLALLGAVSVLGGALIICVRNAIWQPLLPAALAAVFWTYFATVTLHPESVNVAEGGAGGGEEAIGLATFFLRAFLKLLPLYFFALTSVGVLIAALSLFDLAGPILPLAQISIIPVPFAQLFVTSNIGFGGVALVVTACLLPLLGYAGYLLCSLPLDLWRALLSLPRKVDALKR
jgi:hypothetical protein